MSGRHRNPVTATSDKGEVLVGILNEPRDLELVKTERWYRIPVVQAKKWINTRWPPDWLAFYHTKAIEPEPYGIYYYAQVGEIREVRRGDLLPDERNHRKGDQLYFQVFLKDLRRLERPILSRCWRRIVFIRTTWQKFVSAVEINDLFDESPLEDRLWAELKQREIQAERQYFVTVNGTDYALDFAVECKKGNLDIETDGDTWHADPKRIPQDNRRDNNLELGGWSLLRFNTAQLNDEMIEYCIPSIVKKVESLGGLKGGRVIARDVSDDGQLGLFQ
jgi:very-short-patch-repair endonuclease